MTATPLDELVPAAARGDPDAWAELVDRYTPLVLSVIRNFGLNRADAADVNQTVWLRLVEHLDRIREPLALPGWIAKTAGHECLRLVRASRRTQPFDPLDPHVGAAGPQDQHPLDDGLLRAERHHVLREGFAELPLRCRQLLTLLMRDPPASYDEICAKLEMRVGSIGPTRARCLHKLRTRPVVAAFLHEQGEAQTERGDRDGLTALRRR